MSGLLDYIKRLRKKWNLKKNKKYKASWGSNRVYTEKDYKEDIEKKMNEFERLYKETSVLIKKHLFTFSKYRIIKKELFQKMKEREEELFQKFKACDEEILETKNLIEDPIYMLDEKEVKRKYGEEKKREFDDKLISFLNKLTKKTEELKIFKDDVEKLDRSLQDSYYGRK